AVAEVKNGPAPLPIVQSKPASRIVPLGDVKDDTGPGPGGRGAAFGMRTDDLPFDAPILDRGKHLDLHLSVLVTRVVCQHEAGRCLGGGVGSPPAAASVSSRERRVH